MPEHLRISVRFLQEEFHGRGDDGDCEWPPSPLRLFQALTNAAARLEGAGIGQQHAAALRCLEALQPPEILAAKVSQTTGYQLYVPDNVGDLVAKQWSAGKYFDSKNHPIDISAYRTGKAIRPLRLSGGAAVHYFWHLDATATIELVRLSDALTAVARAITHLGWGVDLAIADVAIEESLKTNKLRDANTLERWLPVGTSGGSSLRVPKPGTFDALENRHSAFLSRLQTAADGRQFLWPVPPLANFRVVTYRRETELSRPPYAVFALRLLDDSQFAAFDPQWRRLHLTGMLRHTASRPDFAAALGWDQTKIDAFVLGHDRSDPSNARPTANALRLVFIPLPSIEWRGEDRGRTVGAIRRVLVTISGSEGQCDSAEFSRIVRALEGRELVDEKNQQHPIAFLRQQSANDRAVSSYFESSSSWTTVTPVVLPGHDDPRKLRRRLRDAQAPLSAAEKEVVIRKLDARIERLLRKAFLDSGIPGALLADADLEWRDTGFLPGADLASRYSVPDQCRRFRRLHVRIAWRERAPTGEFRPIRLPGHFCVGSGRFAGLGLFAPVEG